VSVDDASDDIDAFLAVFAALLLDTVLRFEEVVDSVTGLVMGTGRPNSDLVVALQGFDRVKQEFEALGDALARYAATTSACSPGSEERVKIGHDVIASITIADLKNRLLRRLQDDVAELVSPPLALDEIF
jgi:hypothetical protein